MQTDYLFKGIKGFERFAYYYYRYDTISKEANINEKLIEEICHLVANSLASSIALKMY